MSVLQTGRLQAPQGVKWLAQSHTGPERRDSSLGHLIPPPCVPFLPPALPPQTCPAVLPSGLP